MRVAQLRVSAIVLILFLAFTAPACLLAPPSPPNTWTAEVTPSLICPGESVTVTWNAGPWSGCRRDGRGGFTGHDLDCGHPTRLMVTTFPNEMFASDPIDSRETAGRRLINPTQNTSIIFSATGRNEPTPRLGRVISVMTEDDRDSGYFYGVCDAGRPAWQELNLSKSWLPESAELTEICNPNDFRVTVFVTTGTRSATFELSPRGDETACTGRLEDVTAVTASTRDDTILAGSGCSGVLSAPPRPIRVLETWSCP
ncbi:MAG: hypothetical protein AAF481_16900 [Acidobacteriota bacterium]